MSNTGASTVPAAILRRTYNASRERVFAAWTQPEIAARFLGPDDITIPKVEMDVRTGGSYRIAMHRPDGETWYVGGVYREVRAPERLCMTWRWEEDNTADEHESLLTLEFNEVNGGTELVLIHEQLATEESRAGHESGWSMILDKLATTLEN
ncbi:MAG: SRPBCC domain-containing protein [Candidatus Eremiobacteraeota bacterium]|nr:SRPBCC domain-containing protein [Candidatus Eremiobacteraeota bacterium]